MATNYLYPSGATFLDPADTEYYLLPDGTTTVQAASASNWNDTARDNLGHMEWCGILNEGIPIGVSGLTAQRDKQHLFEGYPGVLYGAASPPTYKSVHLPLLGVG